MSEPALRDVVIAGGGMVGASLAAALESTGLAVSLVEPSALEPGKGGQSGSGRDPDQRATALALSSRRFFEALDLWGAIAEGATPIRHIHVSERGRFSRVRLSAEDLELPALGHVVPNPMINAALAGRLETGANTELVADSARGELEQSKEWVALPLSSGQWLRTRLLVIADGARSRLREQLDIPVNQVDFGQHALVANVEVSRDLAGRAWERFTDSGPMALLPLGGRRANLVLCLRPEAASRWQTMKDHEFLAACHERFGAHLGAWRAVGKRQVFPLVQVRARALTSHRCVLAGNAAMSLHPVAGQGFNLALRGVADLAETLAAAAAAGQDPGDPGLLAAHAKRREADIEFTARWTRSLADAFTLGLPAAGLARSGALLMLDRVPVLRRWFARRATGMGPGLPALCRGVRPPFGDAGAS